MAYAVHHGYELEFSSMGKISNLGDFSENELFCDVVEELCSLEEERDLQRIYKALKTVPKQEFDDEHYADVVLMCESDLMVTGLDRILAVKLHDLKVKSVLNWGTNHLSLLGAMESHVKYTAVVNTKFKYKELLVRIATELFPKREVSVIRQAPENPNASVSKEDFDAVVYYIRHQVRNMPFPAQDFLNTFYVENKSKYAFLTMDLISPQRGALEGGHLASVIDVSDEGLSPYRSPYKHILMFDMKEAHDTVEYPDGSMVSYEQIMSNHGWLNAPLYTKRSVPDGSREYTLSEIANLRESPRMFGVSSDRRMPTYHLSKSFADVASPMYKPQKEISPGRTWGGQHLHLGRSNRGVYAAISNTSGRYRCDCDVAIIPDPEKVTIEYLAWVLMNDEQFAPLFNIVPVSVLDNYRVVIPEDLEEQRAIVQRELDKNKEVVNSSGVYKVIIVNGSGLFTPEDIEQIREWNLTVQANLSSVSGTNGLKEALPFAIKEGARVDAILFDASTDAKGTRLKGLQGAFKLGREKKIPVFVYSSIPLDDVRADLEEDDLKYCEKGHLFSSEGEFALKKYITAVRDALDNDGTLGAQLRQQYKNEFKAAEKVDELFDGTTAKDLEKFLSKPNEVLNEVRISVEGLLKQIVKRISSGSGLEKVRTGMLPKLFKDSVIEDKEGEKKGVFVFSGRIMEKTLGTALVYMYQILNGASHGDSEETVNELNVISYIRDSGTTNIAMSVIRIYMEFLVWLASTNGEFDVQCEFRDAQSVSVYCNGTVHCVTSKELYIDTEDYPKIRLGGNKFREGQKVFVKSIVPEKSPDHVHRYYWYTSDVSLAK